MNMKMYMYEVSRSSMDMDRDKKYTFLRMYGKEGGGNSHYFFEIVWYSHLSASCFQSINRTIFKVAN